MAKRQEAYVNANMLMWARQQTPFSTADEVAGRVSDISADELDNWETGNSLPTIRQLKKLAHLYKVPFACFFLSSPPQTRVRSYTDRRTFQYTTYEETTYELWNEIERITANRDKLLEISDTDGIVNELPNLRDQSTTDENAEIIRTFLGINPPFKTKKEYKNNAFNYFRNIIEERGIIVAQLSGISLSEMKGISIYYDQYPIIAVNNKDFPNARVFSLFHELVHVFRRSSSLCTIDFDEREDDEEKICDSIAAAILMPKNIFKDIVLSNPPTQGWSSSYFQKIGDKFGVSLVAALRRCHDVGIIKTPLYKSLYQAINHEFEENRLKIELANKGKNFPVDYHIKYLNQQGFLFPRIVLTAYAKGEMPYGEMCKTLNVSGKYIENIERAVMIS